MCADTARASTPGRRPRAATVRAAHRRAAAATPSGLVRSRTAAPCRPRESAPGSRLDPCGFRPCGRTSGPGGPRRAGPRPPPARAPRPGTRRRRPAGRTSAAPPLGLAAVPARRRRSASHGGSTSWLESTHVGGAPTSTSAPMLRSMAARIAVASHGASRKWKLNAVCSSPGRTYLATCSGVCSQTSPTKIRSPGYESLIVAPRPVHVVDLVLVPVRMPAGRRTRPEPPGEVRHLRVLGQPVGDVDAEPVDAPIEPEPEDRLELRRAPRRSSSRDRVGRHRTGAGTTGRAARRCPPPSSMPTRRSCSASRSAARHRRSPRPSRNR